MYRNRRFRKSKNSILISIISLSFLFCLSLGYSSLRESLEMGVGVKFSPTPKLKATTSSDTTAFRSSTYKERIKSITFEDEINAPDDAVEGWDIGERQNGDVMAYVVANEDDSTYYDLYIQADGTIKANENMSHWFSGFAAVDSINGLELLDTSNTTDMSYMFNETGSLSTTFTLDVSNFDTSNVTNMQYMFSFAGANNIDFTLDVSKFDTSKVTNMSNMFNYTGYNSTIFTLDVSEFDTSKVKNMSNMFNSTGYNSTIFALDVSNFDTSAVTNMNSMFQQTGYSSTNVVFDLSNFDTSKVTNMSYMFYQAGYSNTNFTLDLSVFDTSSVTNMSYMFYQTGYNSTKLNTSILIKNPNTISYSALFSGVATKTGSQITVNYISETSDLVDQMIATKSSNSNVVKGNLIMNFDNLNKGDEVTIGSEKFNVISQTDDTITLLAKYNLGADFYQSSTLNLVAYSTEWNHEYFSVESGDTESIDLKNYGTIAYDLSYSYASLISEILGNHSVSATILDTYILKDLGCEYSSDLFGNDTLTCSNSSFSNILNNGQKTWTAMVYAEPYGNAYPIYLDGAGSIGHQSYTSTAGVRPVITISKKSNLENNIKTFKISDKVYRTFDGMIWEEWIDSDFNENEFKIGNCYCDVGCNSDGDLDGYFMYSVKNNTLTIAYPGQGNVPFINVIDPSINYVLEMWDTNSNSCGDI